MSSSSSDDIWNCPEIDFFLPNERKQLKYAYQNYIMNTKQLENNKTFVQSKLQLFQLFIRTYPINIRSFSLFHQQQQKCFVEKLFYLILNSVDMTHFQTFNIQSIITLSSEFEKYQRYTNKSIVNTGKLNAVIQFVLSFSSSTTISFSINNLFYLLLNDMSDFSGKSVDRISELLRTYHFMTYGHTINKNYLVATVDNGLNTANYCNPLVYMLYENFLSNNYVYKCNNVHLLLLDCNSLLPSSKQQLLVKPLSLYTIIQNLSFLLLGLQLEDFPSNDVYLNLSADNCYNIKLTIRYLVYLYQHHQLTIEFPLRSIDKQIVVLLIHSIIINNQTYEKIKHLLDLLIKYIHYRQIKSTLKFLCDKQLFQQYIIETMSYFLALNKKFDDEYDEHDNENKCGLKENQFKLISNKHYSVNIYEAILLPYFEYFNTFHQLFDINLKTSSPPSQYNIDINDSHVVYTKFYQMINSLVDYLNDKDEETDEIDIKQMQTMFIMSTQ
ncbi:unnamed protein product [Didymodactylos carnosus]|uniref:Uncharacterized protein n=1 Tax=Didymodactylos carnosus TaxID=1234261 RepID=A0A813SP86_9BILA|nr:unnamed protein product [Didymodactylos carnosus]CAF3588724.1 unnamed protein product [Didymodactylos carnosus]